MKGAILFLILLAAMFAFVVTALAQSGGTYTLTWSTVDGGGGSSSGGSYTLGGTIGQPDAETMSGGSYTLGGGFWGGVTLALDIVKFKGYLPQVLK